jgi:ARMET, N-terminal
MFRLLLAVCVLIATIGSTGAAKKAKVADPRDCEVCVSNLEKIDKLVPADKKRDREAIEKAIFTRCTLTGFGSDWKPNPALESPRDVKMCYLFEPIKKAISQPFSTGMPKLKVCKRLMKDNPEICEVKYRKFTTGHVNDVAIYFLKCEQLCLVGHRRALYVTPPCITSYSIESNQITT